MDLETGDYEAYNYNSGRTSLKLNHPDVNKVSPKKNYNLDLN